MGLYGEHKAIKMAQLLPLSETDLARRREDIQSMLTFWGKRAAEVEKEASIALSRHFTSSNRRQKSEDYYFSHEMGDC